jgi:hypothetical protein
VVFDGTVPSLVGQLLARSCTGALATLRKGTCGALAFRCSTELTDFLADLDAADDEKRSKLQHQLHTARFKVTTTGTVTPVVFDGTVPSLALVGQLLARSCIGALATLRKGTCGALAFRCSTELTDFLADLDAADDEKRSKLQHQLHGRRFKVATTGTTHYHPRGVRRHRLLACRPAPRSLCQRP